MARPLGELASLQRDHGYPPILYCGDIFDKWNEPPEVINFALERLPRGYAVPGQHDLPDHQYAAIKRSAYWTLVEAGNLVNLPPAQPFVDSVQFEDLVVYGFPWGVPIRPAENLDADACFDGYHQAMRVAVSHRYVWTAGCSYSQAREEDNAARGPEAYAGYTLAAFGDNHIGFQTQVKPKGGGVVQILNCGGFMRRHADEIAYAPAVGLLLSDGTVRRHYLDISQDIIAEKTEAEVVAAAAFDMDDFVADLAGLSGGDELDFIEAIRLYTRTHEVPDPVLCVLNKILQGG